jgi:hypothetical protein
MLLMLLSLPSRGRESFSIVAFFLPLWLGWFWGARQATHARKISEAPLAREQR